MHFRVTRLLQTAARFHQPLDLPDLQFRHPPSDDRHLVVSGPAEADDYRDALRDFDARMLRATDAIAVARLIAISSYGAPTLIEGKGTNLGLLEYSVSDESQPVLLIGDDDIDTDIKRAFESLEDPVLGAAARHYRESILAGSVLTDILHLIRAAEALSAKRSRGKPATDYNALKKLLGDEVYSFFYVSSGEQSGVRHDLMHGRLVDQEILKSQADPLRRTVERTIGKLATLAAQPVFRPFGFKGHRRYHHWLSFGGPRPSLQSLVQMGAQDQLRSDGDPRLLIGTGEVADAFRQFGVKS
ncbi:MAG: hypothetical protein WD556_06210 [Actinomycetota bacterium]